MLAEIDPRITSEIGRAYLACPDTLEATEATFEGFRRFALGVGDLNPKWIDRAYSKGTGEEVTAPPMWPFSVDNGAMAATGLGGSGERIFPDNERDVLLGSIGCTFDRPIKEGVRLTVRRTLVNVQAKQSKAYGDIVITDGETAFLDQDENRLACIQCSIIWRPKGAQWQGMYEPVGSDKFIHPDDAAGMVNRRGCERRWWEDVGVGDKISPLNKGTLTIVEMARWFGMARGLPRGRRSDRLSWHFDSEVARQTKMPHSFDEGPQRTAWMAQAVSDWLGDHGRLASIKSRIQRINFVGYNSTVRGRVVGKDIVGARGMLSLEVFVEDHSGAVTANAEITAELSIRGA